MSDKKANNNPVKQDNYTSIPANLNMPSPPIDNQKIQQEFERLKLKLEDFKKKVIKKFPFTNAIGLLPANANILFEEEENIPKEVSNTKPIHVVMLIPEEEYKNLQKIKPEIVNLAKETGENLWVHIKTEVDLWNYGLDSRFEFIDALSASYPIHDKGFLGALRVANIHKSLVLRKFDKYITSYVIGGSLVRGTADKESDVDTFVIIDDTDVKRMSKVELVEKLRAWINDYLREATILAGVKNILNVQVWLLTDFWKRVKDTEPVAFTFIRDGIPLYDRGTFIPWKRLLNMGQIRPSPEAIELYMKEGERTSEMVKRNLLDAMVNIYYGIVTPTQAMFMLAGEAIPVPKTIAAEAKKIFVERDKVMTSENLRILEKAVKLFKEYEHGKLNEFSGKEIDTFLKEGKDYQESIREMEKKLTKKINEKSAEEIYESVFGILKRLLGENSQEKLVKEFESKLVKKGKIPQRFSKILDELISVKNKIKSGKLNTKEVDIIKKNSNEFIDALVEFAQRADVMEKEKGLMQITYGNRKGELALLGSENFLVEGNSIKKITSDGIINSNKEELEKSLAENKGKLHTTLSDELFIVLHKHLGKFEITF